jgi:F-type H+-transporting ATPase subunit b
MVWILIIFAVLYAFMAWIILPRISKTIDAREDAISGDIGEARRLRDQAQAEAEQAAQEVAQARAQGLRLAAQAQAEAKAKAAARQAEEEAKLNDLVLAAEARIAEARSEAMAHVRTIAQDAAGAMVERLTGVAASGPELTRALTAHDAA